MMQQINLNQQRGFTLIELVIVLGITGLIFSGLWGLLTSGSSQLQAQTAAQQYRQVVEAARKYVTSEVDAGTMNVVGQHALAITGAAPSLAAAGLVSTSFTNQDAYGNTISVLIDTIDAAKQQWRIIVYSNRTVVIPDKAGAQIASLIGSEGGFVYANATDGCTTAGTATTIACGSFNSFALTLAPLGIGAGAGRIVALGYTVDTNAGTAPWLYRKAGLTPEQNTMQQNMLFNNGLTLSMQGSGINMGAGKMIMGGGALSMGGDAATTGGGILYMGAGNINDVGNISGGNSTLTFNNTTMTINDLTANAAQNITLRATLGTRVTSTAAVTLDITGVGKADEFQAGKFIYSSDISMKENLVPIANALQKILSLRGFNYDWKGTHGHDVGLMAQDVQKVFPELVTKLPEGKLGVDYAKIIAPVVEAIRQLKSENDALRTKVDELQKQISAHH